MEGQHFNAEIDRTLSEPNYEILIQRVANLVGLFNDPKVPKDSKTYFAVSLAKKINQTSDEMLPIMNVIALMMGAIVEFGADADDVGRVYVPAITRVVKVVRDEEALHKYELATVAILSRSKSSRVIAREHNDLLETSVTLRWKCRFLHHICQVLDNEEIYIIHPTDGWGFVVNISGVSDNWQLHILLADKLHKPTNGNWALPPHHVVKCMLGIGEQQLNGSMVGVWNMYNWTALGSNQKLESEVGQPGGGFFKNVPSSDHWIWGEGVPADIQQCPYLNNKRIIFLGPAPYNRSMSLCRDFDALVAIVDIVEKMTEEQIHSILQTISQVPTDIKNTCAVENGKRTNVETGKKSQ